MKDEKSVGIGLSPTLLVWAFAYPEDLVAAKVIASLPPNLAPKLREMFKQSRESHDKAFFELKALFEGSSTG